MRSEPPPLLPIFRSRHQAELLTRLFMNPDREFTLTELAELLGTPMTTIHREVERLVQAELISARSVGRTRLLRGNSHHRLARPLTDLLIATFGPREVIQEELAGIAGIEMVIIYGSWAARYEGVAGPTPNDIDVLLIGRSVDRGAVYDAADRAQQRLGIPVNPVVSSPARWEKAADALIREVRSAPMIVLSMGGDRDAEVGEG